MIQNLINIAKDLAGSGNSVGKATLVERYVSLLQTLYSIQMSMEREGVLNPDLVDASNKLVDSASGNIDTTTSKVLVTWKEVEDANGDYTAEDLPYPIPSRAILQLTGANRPADDDFILFEHKITPLKETGEKYYKKSYFIKSGLGTVDDPFKPFIDTDLYEKDPEGNPKYDIEFYFREELVISSADLEAVEAELMYALMQQACSTSAEPAVKKLPTSNTKLFLQYLLNSLDNRETLLPFYDSSSLAGKPMDWLPQPIATSVNYIPTYSNNNNLIDIGVNLSFIGHNFCDAYFIDKKEVTLGVPLSNQKVFMPNIAFTKNGTTLNDHTKVKDMGDFSGYIKHIESDSFFDGINTVYKDSDVANGKIYSYRVLSYFNDNPIGTSALSGKHVLRMGRVGSTTIGGTTRTFLYRVRFGSPTEDSSRDYSIPLFSQFSSLLGDVILDNSNVGYVSNSTIVDGKNRVQSCSYITYKGLPPKKVNSDSVVLLLNKPMSQIQKESDFTPYYVVKQYVNDEGDYKVCVTPSLPANFDATNLHIFESKGIIAVNTGTGTDALTAIGDSSRDKEEAPRRYTIDTPIAGVENEIGTLNLSTLGVPCEMVKFFIKVTQKNPSGVNYHQSSEILAVIKEGDNVDYTEYAVVGDLDEFSVDLQVKKVGEEVKVVLTTNDSKDYSVVVEKQIIGV